MTYGWTGMYRRSFEDPPNHNLDVDPNLGKKMRDMRLIRITRPFYRRDISMIRIQIK